MPRWAVEIEHTGLEERNLSDLLGRLGFSVVQFHKGVAFTSTEIDACATAGEVFEFAKRVRRAFTGPAEIDGDFVARAVVDFSTDPPKRHSFLEVHDAVHLHVSAGVALVANAPKNQSAEDRIARERERAEREYQVELEEQSIRLVAAFRSEKAEKVMELLSAAEQTGASLYRVYELMEGDPKKNRTAFHVVHGVQKVEFQRFKDAVHNPRATGEWARHAYEYMPESQNPMTRSEAETFVRALAARWMASL